MTAAQRLGQAWRRVRLVAGLWLLGIVVLGVGIVVALQFVGPPPPRHIVIATGAAGGAYQKFGERIAAYLGAEGIDVELRETAGAVDNLALLGKGDEVDLAFVQGGLAEHADTDGVDTLGSLYLEPLWLFVDATGDIEDLTDLAGKRVAVGSEGSGTRVVVTRLLETSGIDPGDATLLDLAPEELAEAFGAGRVDAAFLISGPESGYVQGLVHRADVELRSIQRADAYVRHAPYLSRVTLPRGVLDLKADKPGADVTTVAVTAMLCARRDLHPAISDLLMIAAQNIFGGHSLLSDAGQFPTPRYADLPLSREAERYYEHGPPFLMRYLPFWAATLVDRLWVMLLPLIGLSIPLAKLLPPLYRWRIRRRLLHRYDELRAIDPLNRRVEGEQDRRARQRVLEQLDLDSAGDIVPKSYSDDVYKLRRDIDLVRRRLDAT
ncbi:MAG: TAXI family TRAP transporter solute-binding subunit [Woeseiaceae bacterium]